MTSKVVKTPLNFDEYEKYEIPQEYMAYVVEFSDVTQMECDDIEYDYHVKGYKIFSSEINRAFADRFHYKLVIAKSEMTFQK